MSKLNTALVVSSFLFSVVIYGACISGIVLREPDICFLLAGGRWIVEHGQIPQTDPFSYSTIYHKQPYVIEKWLTEVVFYLIWKWTSTTGLLVFDAVLLALAFVVMPFRILKLNGVGGLRALSLTWFVALTSFCHFAVRGEIFSYCFIGVFLELLIRLAKNVRAIHWPTIIGLTVIMAFWANLHTLFIVGLLILLAYSGCMFAERLLPLTEKKALDWTVPVALCTCLAATLATPYGLTLWPYLLNVFGSFNDTNNEMQPVSLNSLHVPAFYPFFLLIPFSLYLLSFRGLKLPLQPGDLFFKMLIPAGIVGGIKTIRTMPISDLFISTGVARIFAGNTDKQSPLDKGIDEICQPLHPRWMATCLVAAGLGSFLMTQIIVPEIPEGSAAFAPPVKAIEFLRRSPPAGRMLNDADFGDVMMWQLEQTPPVFIDTRYNLFGNQVLQDYWTMALCRSGWHDLLDKYVIDWVFLPPDLALIKALGKDADWHLVYQDKASVIYARHQPPLGK